MASAGRRRMTVGLLAAGLVGGLVMAPASASSPSAALGTETPTMVLAAQAQANVKSKHKSKAKGSARLRIRANIGLPDVHYLTRVRVTGVVQRHGQVVRRVTIPMRVVPDAPSLASHFGGRLALRSLAPGRYRVILKRISADTTVPGGRYPSRALSTQAGVKPLTVRSKRTTHWRPESVNFDDFYLVLTGRVVDPQGNPISGLPVCGLSSGRGWRSRDCRVVSKEDGSYAMPLKMYNDVDTYWESLGFGDPLRDLPWVTADDPNPLTERSTTTTIRPRGDVTGVVTGAFGQGLAGVSACAGPPASDSSSYDRRVARDRAWCTETDLAGHYSLRVQGGEQIFFPSDPTSQGFVERMDTFLADDSAELLRLRDVGWTPYWTPGSDWRAETYRDMFARPGGTLDVALTDLVPGQDISLSGRITLEPDPKSFPGYSGSICAYSRAGPTATI